MKILDIEQYKALDLKGRTTVLRYVTELMAMQLQGPVSKEALALVRSKDHGSIALDVFAEILISDVNTVLSALKEHPRA